uniref:Uncharacterized protein n=1 Tax=Aegilops tauschii subsp. strangulata TaxID=200361 RepID=A0A453N1Y2_AEGTS
SSLLLILCCLSLLRAGSDASVTAGATDGSELWGYVEVRPKAHLFWWYYKSPQRVSTPSTPWPTVLWLQGGPLAVISIFPWMSVRRAGSVRRRDRQLPGGRAAGRPPQPPQLHLAAEGRPHLRGQPRGRRVQLRGERQRAGDERLGGGRGRHGAPQGAGHGGARPAGGEPAVPRRRVLRRQVRRHARRLRRPGHPRRRAQP